MMKNLNEQEEKINQLKMDLISRFYPFTVKEILHYQEILNFGNYWLMKNKSIEWDIKLIDALKHKIDWSSIGRLGGVKLDITFFKKFERFIDFKTIIFSENVEWSIELIEAYGDKLDWNNNFINRDNFAPFVLGIMRKYHTVLNWSVVSRNTHLPLTYEILGEFEEFWDWEMLSSNPRLPLTDDFLIQYMDKLNFDNLSMNAVCLPLIYKYPNSKRWNWEKVIINAGLEYSQETFDFIYPHYEKQFEEKNDHYTLWRKKALPSLILTIFSRSFLKDLNFFFREEFLEYIPWEFFSKNYRSNLTMDFVETHKDKLNFKELQFIWRTRDFMTTDFVLENPNLFDGKYILHYDLLFTIEQLHNCFSDIDWNLLSSCTKLDWSMDYIYNNLDNFNLYRLSENKGVYNELIEKFSKDEIFSFLNNQMGNKMIQTQLFIDL